MSISFIRVGKFPPCDCISLFVSLYQIVLHLQVLLGIFPMLANCIKKKQFLLLILLYVPFWDYHGMDHFSSFFAFEFPFHVQIYASISILMFHFSLRLALTNCKLVQNAFDCHIQCNDFPYFHSIWFTFFPHSMHKCPTVIELHLSAFLFMYFGFSIIVLAQPPQDYKNIHLCSCAPEREQETLGPSPSHTLPSHIHSDGNFRPTGGLQLPLH